MLIRYHSYPPFAATDNNPERKLLKIASNGELAKGFTLRKLCILERADVLGRISNNADDYLDRIGYCEMLADDICCMDAPYTFADTYSKRAFFRGSIKWRDQKLYNDAWGEVIMLAGLPGTGKDT